MRRKFEGMCVGGPAHGQWYSMPGPCLQVAESPGVQMYPGAWVDITHQIKVYHYHWTEDKDGGFFKLEGWKP